MENGRLAFSHLLSCGESAVSAIHFGQIGREGSCLSMLTRKGELFIRILRREAAIEPMQGSMPSETTPGYSVKPPKRSPLLIREMCREREQCVEAYRRYLLTFKGMQCFVERAYAASLTKRSLNTQTSAVCSNTSPSLRLTGTIQVCDKNLG